MLRGIFAALFAFMATMGFLGEGYFFVVTGLLFFSLIIFGWKYFFSGGRNWSEPLCFSLDSDGITYVNRIKRIFIAWQEVAVFGIAFGGWLGYSFTRETCLYVSKTELDKKGVAKKYWHGRSRYVSPPAAADHSFLVLVFDELNAEQVLCQKLISYFETYCGKEKRIDYTEQMYSNTEPTCCDAQSFEVQVAGEIKHEFPGKFRLLAENDCVGIAGKCTVCGKRKVFFERTNEDFPMRKIVSCPKCGASDFSVCIIKEHIDTEQTLALPLEEKLAYEGKGNVSRLDISLFCNRCKKTYPSFLDVDAF